MTATQENSKEKISNSSARDFFNRIWILTLRGGTTVGSSVVGGIQTRFFLFDGDENGARRIAARYCERMDCNFMNVRPFLTEIGAVENEI